MTRTPLQGLKILEELHKRSPHNESIYRNLINAYIKLGQFNTALKMIDLIPDRKSDISTLKLKAWCHHQEKNLTQEKEIWNSILRKMITPTLDVPVKTLIKISQHQIHSTQNDITLFCKVYNEIHNLPFYLDYYRKLGVTQFFFIDNKSTDGSGDFLLKQHDCHVFWTNDSHVESGSGTIWINQLVKEYCIEGSWIIYADADEFLVYPHCEINTLDKLTTFLDQQDYHLLRCFMLDVCTEDFLFDTQSSLSKTFSSNGLYFYNNYQNIQVLECPYIKPVGGIFTIFGIIQELCKISLVKVTKDFRFIGVNHSSTPNRVAELSSVYLHVKLDKTLVDKVTNEKRNKQYANGGQKYRYFSKMLTYLESNKSNLVNRLTKYQNSQQLVDLGLITCTNEWLSFIEDLNN